jgi:hypothetical protein
LESIAISKFKVDAILNSERARDSGSGKSMDLHKNPSSQHQFLETMEKSNSKVQEKEPIEIIKPLDAKLT